jgi:hypothetical protein
MSTQPTNNHYGTNDWQSRAIRSSLPEIPLVISDLSKLCNAGEARCPKGNVFLSFGGRSYRSNHAVTLDAHVSTVWQQGSIEVYCNCLSDRHDSTGRRFTNVVSLSMPFFGIATGASGVWSKLAATDGTQDRVPHLARQCERTTEQSARHKEHCEHPAPPRW